jgi:sugar phosphate isomerase/epimerase
MAPGPARADAPAGTGILRWDTILPAASAAGARWWIVEQDHPADPLADAILGVINVEAMLRTS